VIGDKSTTEISLPTFISPSCPPTVLILLLGNIPSSCLICPVSHVSPSPLYVQLVIPLDGGEITAKRKLQDKWLRLELQ
jgi:hypothetical protein